MVCNNSYEAFLPIKSEPYSKSIGKKARIKQAFFLGFKFS